MDNNLTDGKKVFCNLVCFFIYTCKGNFLTRRNTVFFNIFTLRIHCIYWGKVFLFSIHRILVNTNIVCVLIIIGLFNINILSMIRSEIPVFLFCCNCRDRIYEVLSLESNNVTSLSLSLQFHSFIETMIY